MTNGPHRDPVVDLEDFLPRLADSQKKNSVPITERRDWAARSELRFDILASVGDRLDPTIRLFDHATVSLNTAAILLSGKVVMPWRETTLIRG